MHWQPGEDLAPTEAPIERNAPGGGVRPPSYQSVEALERATRDIPQVSTPNTAALASSICCFNVYGTDM